MIAITIYAEPLLPGFDQRWSVRTDYIINRGDNDMLSIQDTGLTTAQMLAELAGSAPFAVVRVHVADLTSPIGVLPSGRTVYGELSVTR